MTHLTSSLKEKNKATKKGLTPAEYAKAKEVHITLIKRYIKNGLIKLDKNKRINPIDADKRLNKFLDPTYRRRTKAEEEKAKESKSSTVDFYESKALEKEYQAKIAQLKYKEYIKELVRAKDVELAAFTMARKVRDNLLNIPERIVSQLISQFSIEVIPETINKGRKIIKIEIEKALQELI